MMLALFFYIATVVLELMAYTYPAMTTSWWCYAIGGALCLILAVSIHAMES